MAAKQSDDSLAALGRFSEPALYILISLADGPKHGYAMTQDIATVSGQKLGPGTLYGAIARLEARKWIEALPAEEAHALVLLRADVKTEPALEDLVRGAPLVLGLRHPHDRLHGARP